jgi:hypothetical protein
MPDKFFSWGSKPVYVQAEVASALSAIGDMKIKTLLWKSAVQGVGDALNSKGTHLDGWCVDFSLRREGWNASVALHVAHALIDNFAVAYRAPGEAGPTAHLHIAYKNKANYRAIVNRQINGHTIRKAIRIVFPGQQFAEADPDPIPVLDLDPVVVEV